MTLVRTLHDGTVKHVNFFTGAEAWTVPGRSQRPSRDQEALIREVKGHCNFCPQRYLQTPPEKSRLVKQNGAFVERRGLTASAALDEPAEFRRIANLFEIMPLEYWIMNHGFKPAKETVQRQSEYLADERGLHHVETVLKLKHPGEAESFTPSRVQELSLPFFAGSHELIVARRHFVEGGTRSSSGDLTPDEHSAYVRFAAQTLAEIERLNPHVAYVTLFQNWLKPAGASFDHLHKQLVGADAVGAGIRTKLKGVEREASLFVRFISEAEREGLVIAADDHAVAIADTGQPHPAVIVVSTSPAARLEEMKAGELDGLSRLLHACHAAWDREIPVNEEWHYTPRGAKVQMPVHVVLKWRLNTPAGFEGATGIHINPMSPHAVREATKAGLPDY